MAKRASKAPDDISLQVHPQDWLAKARKLKKAADLLFINFETEQEKFDEEFEKEHDFDLPRPDDTVVTMLLGFGVENLLKGLLVSTLEHVEGGASRICPNCLPGITATRIEADCVCC